MSGASAAVLSGGHLIAAVTLTTNTDRSNRQRLRRMYPPCPWTVAGIVWRMPSPKEILEIGGRQVTVSNPGKIYFPDAGFTKIDVVRYYLTIADGALTGVRGRPMALKRFVDGIAKEPFFQKRAPDNTPDWIRQAEFTFPSIRVSENQPPLAQPLFWLSLMFPRT